MEKWSVNSISVWLLLIFRKKNLVKENKIQKLKKSALYKGDLEEHWSFFWKRSRMDGKEPLQEHISVWEKLLCNIYFLLSKFSRISYTGLHLCSLLFFCQMLIKHLKINVLYEWTTITRQFFRHGFTSLFIFKGERFYDYFSVTFFLGKNSNFLVTYFVLNSLWIFQISTSFFPCSPVV